MLRLIAEFAIFFAMTSLSVVPLIVVGRRLRRRVNRQQWFLAAGGISAAAAFVGWTSRNLRSACLSERNGGCVDFGGTGTQFVILGGFIIWALLSAYLRYNAY